MEQFETILYTVNTMALLCLLFSWDSKTIFWKSFKINAAWLVIFTYLLISLLNGLVQEQYVWGALFALFFCTYSVLLPFIYRQTYNTV